MAPPPIRFPQSYCVHRFGTWPRRPDPSLKVIVDKLVAARFRAGMTQEYVAWKLRTTKSAVSRLESGKLHRPLLTTLENYALVVGCEVVVDLVPVWDRAFWRG